MAAPVSRRITARMRVTYAAAPAAWVNRIPGVGFAQLGKFTRSRPVEFARIDDYTSQRCAVASDKFCRRVYDDVCSMFDRAYQIGRTERVVDNERYVVAVGYLGDGIDVDDVRVGVTQSLDKNSFRVRTYGFLEIRQVGRIDERCRHAVSR